jgi:hypothetical protein
MFPFAARPFKSSLARNERVAAASEGFLRASARTIRYPRS